MDNQEQKQTPLETLREALEGGAMRPVRRMIGSLHPSEVARLLESLPPAERAVVWELVDPDDEGDILVEVADEVRSGLIERMDAQELIAATEGMELDDLADLVAGLPETVTRQVLRSLDKQDRDRLREVLSYPEDSAGGLMNKDTVTVRPDVTLEVVVRYLRVHGGMPDQTESIFVVNRDDIFLGTLTLSRLLTNDPDLTVAEVMDTETKPIPAETSDKEVVRFFENRDLLSAAVVDMDNRLLGRITVDDVLDVIREEAEHSLMSRAGLDEEDDMFAPVVTSARRRAVWLGINLATAFLAASVVDLFQGTVDAIVLLAVLMPVVPSMGGVAGTQSLTIITRAMALGQIDKSNARQILVKEVSVGILNGVGWALVVAVVTVAWFGTWMVAAVIAAALTLNMIVAAAAGFVVPLTLKRLGVDPAIAGGVVLTTVTDVVGLMVFLGLGTLLLL
jgi:magnesium transporter